MDAVDVRKGGVCRHGLLEWESVEPHQLGGCVGEVNASVEKASGCLGTRKGGDLGARSSSRTIY